MTFNLRTILALVFGAALVAGAFLLRPEMNAGIGNSIENGSLTVREFIPVKDSDRNGIPDWQEIFAVSTINLEDLTSTGSTTYTGHLITSLADYLSEEGSSASEALSLIGMELAAASTDTQYTNADIIVSEDNSETALRSYGNAVAAIALGYPLPPGTKNELAIMEEYSMNDDPEVLSGLDPIIETYSAMRNDMLELPVPSSMVREHLSLTNVYNALFVDITAFSRIEEDALPTTLRYKRYPADAAALKKAISNLYLKLHQNGIQWSDEDTASRFIEINL